MQFKLFDLGLTDYQSAWDFQKSVFLQVKAGQMHCALILCQHKSAITMGRKSDKRNILADKADLQRLNIRIFEIERGGEVTYHGPGQLCVYPIANLTYFKKDINWFLRSLEALVLDTLSDFGIQAKTRPGLTGVWVKTRKIASIGIAIRSWITFHGLSLNVKSSDLANFSLIRPCGQDIMMTSMENILREGVEIKRVKEALTRRWYETSNFAGIG
ncbi:MAG: lipoyl(octanoyl) transferase LipB [Candidatus Omnitrophota bacterium]|jgi:lipoate-protein ligase B